MGLHKEEYKIWYGRTAAQKLFPALKIYWVNQVCLIKFTTKTAGQMGFGMNVIQEEINKEYGEACHNMAQAYLSQQTAMSNMPNNSIQMDAMQQQMNVMQQMFQ